MAALAVATLILGLLVIYHKVPPISAGCGSIFLPHQHHALVGHSFLAQTGTGRMQCMTLCWRHSRCLSFNHDDTSGTCQLNDARKEEFPESYKQDGHLSYFGSSKRGAFEATTAADKTATHFSEPPTTPTTAATTPTTAATTPTTAATTPTTAATTPTTAATTPTTAATTPTTAATTPTTVATTPTTAATTPTTVATTPTTVATTSKVYSTPLGMESGAIADHQITAKNALNDDYENYGATLARFNSGSSWCGKERTSTWIQVDLGRTVDLCGMIVQGRKGANQYVAHFYLSYSDDGIAWTGIVNEDGSKKYHFSNRSNSEDIAVSVESAPSVGMIRSRYIRIIPSGWVDEICMRFELLGCN